MSVPRLLSYRSTRGGQPDHQARCVRIGPLDLWFSYETLIAYDVDGHGIVSRGRWYSRSTSAHNNAIHGSNSFAYVGTDEFERMFATALASLLDTKDLTRNAPAGVVADWMRDHGYDDAADILERSAAKECPACGRFHCATAAHVGPPIAFCPMCGTKLPE